MWFCVCLRMDLYSPLCLSLFPFELYFVLYSNCIERTMHARITENCLFCFSFWNTEKLSWEKCHDFILKQTKNLFYLMNENISDIFSLYSNEIILVSCIAFCYVKKSVQLTVFLSVFFSPSLFVSWMLFEFGFFHSDFVSATNSSGGIGWAFVGDMFNQHIR